MPFHGILYLILSLFRRALLRRCHLIMLHTSLIVLILPFIPCNHPALLILLNSPNFVVLSTIRALPLFDLHLVVVALIAYLILAITRIELLLNFLQIGLAHVAYIVSSCSVWIALLLVVFILVLSFAGTVVAFLATGAETLSVVLLFWSFVLLFLVVVVALIAI